MSSEYIPSWWLHSDDSWQELEVYFRESYKIKNIDELKKEECWKIISDGRSNHSYCLSLKSTRFFVQITNRSNKIYLPYERIILLKNILNGNAYKELLPWLVNTYFQSENLKIQDWFESQTLSPKLNSDDATIDLLAKFLANLHSHNPEELSAFDLKKHLIKYRDIALRNKKNSLVKQNILDRFEKAITALSSYVPSSLCHYDLNLNNILFDNDKKIMKIIDWEYVCIGDPILDLTALVNNLELSKQHERYFICRYKVHSTSKSVYRQDIGAKKISDMKLLNECIYDLWEYGQ